MKISEQELNGIKIYHVLTDENKLLLSVTPFFGVKILELNLLDIDNNLTPILWKVELDELENNEFGKNDVLFPFPNRLRDGEYQYDGIFYKFPINEKERNNSIHGFLRNKNFSLKNIEIGKDKVLLYFNFIFEGIDYYPFPFSFEIQIELTLNTFGLNFLINNTGKKNLPFGLGWHPYFLLDNIREDKLYLPILNEYEVDNRFLPTGETNLFKDTIYEPQDVFFNKTLELGYHQKPSYILDLGRRKIILKCSKEFSFLQLYTPSGESVIAIEPMTSCVDCLNNKYGLREIQPNELFSANITIKLKNSLVME